MRVTVTIAVRNSEWHWSNEELLKAGEYRKEWEMINEGKIFKHLPSETFEVGFDVIDIRDNRNAIFNLKLLSEDRKQSISYTLSNVTLVDFIGEKGKVSMVISNSLIHQYIATRQKEYKYYVYFYLKECTEYERLNHFVWLSKEHHQELENDLGIKLNGN